MICHQLNDQDSADEIDEKAFAAFQTFLHYTDREKIKNNNVLEDHYRLILKGISSEYYNADHYKNGSNGSMLENYKRYPGVARFHLTRTRDDLKALAQE